MTTLRWNSWHRWPMPSKLFQCQINHLSLSFKKKKEEIFHLRMNKLSLLNLLLAFSVYKRALTSSLCVGGWRKTSQDWGWRGYTVHVDIHARFTCVGCHPRIQHRLDSPKKTQKANKLFFSTFMDTLSRLSRAGSVTLSKRWWTKTWILHQVVPWI